MGVGEREDQLPPEVGPGFTGDCDRFDRSEILASDLACAPTKRVRWEARPVLDPPEPLLLNAGDETSPLDRGGRRVGVIDGETEEAVQ